MDQRRDRATGALLGLALGDAMGMPSQTLSAGEIRQRYGRIEDFVAPFPGHPASHGLGPAMVTDDTEQAFLLARRLIAEPGRFDAGAWAADLLAWEADVRARGLLDLLGPSSKAALAAIAQGVDPAEAGRAGVTNGAAMRIAPVGIATPPDDLARLVDRVEAACRATHNTGEAIAAAAAVAAAVSAGVEGVDFETALPFALAAAVEGQRRGFAAGAPDMAARIEAALTLAMGPAAPEAFAAQVGTSVASHESVPAAFGIVRLAGGDVWRAAVLAANVGDDTDTIGAIAGAMAGACAGAAALPGDKLATLRAANDLPVEALADGLLALRRDDAKR
ncbi:MAG: ADP-ribosylglycohydrolase [Rhodobacteraceae bacterium]|nr:MAG: ADP-ribosylglycohydrolase [Paracoccaceae bacterium]